MKILYYADLFRTELISLSAIGCSVVVVAGIALICAITFTGWMTPKGEKV